MMPRRFRADCPTDRIIYEDDDQVAEMYFVTKGFVAIAINEFRSKVSMGHYEIVHQVKGHQMICYNEVINQHRT